MSYPGNPSLAEEIQEKVLSTYRQTLDLAASGKHQEALLGCDFIQRLDPEFSPVGALQERLKGTQGTVSVEDLRTTFESLVSGGPEQTSESPGDGADAPLDEETVTNDEIDAVFEGIEGEGSATDENELAELEVPPLAPSRSAPAADGDSPEVAEATESELSVTESGAEADKAPPSPDPDTTTSSAEPSAELDEESADRVRELLAEGQAAFESAEYQSAIDAWSRIFLIDIDHPEANRRIDLARKLKAEVERKVDEMYHDGLEAIDAGDFPVAEEKFRSVLELQPNHLAAQEHLERLSSGGAAAGDVEAPELEPTVDEAPPERVPSPDETEYGTDPGTPLDEIDEAPPERQVRPTPRRRASRRPIVIIAALGVVVAAAAAWFLYSNWSRFFPNAAEEVATPQTAPRVDPIVRAQGLHLDGNTAMAISQLRRLPPAHPQYAEAQALIAQWETVLEDEGESGPAAEEIAERDELVARAREAFANREFLEAEDLFTRASQVAPLGESTKALQAETIERLEPLRSEIQIFRQGEWTYALRNLWRRHEEDPENLDVVRLMVNSYYNLGVRELQRGDPAAARDFLREASSLADDDPDVTRLLDFAETYTRRPPDLLYRIFVKYLPFRS